jgi:hypothetical protein
MPKDREPERPDGFILCDEAGRLLKILVVSMFNNELLKFLGIAVITTVNRQMTLLE